MTTHEKIIVRKKDKDKENLPESGTGKVEKVNNGGKDKKITASNHSSEREDGEIIKDKKQNFSQKRRSLSFQKERTYKVPKAINEHRLTLRPMAMRFQNTRDKEKILKGSREEDGGCILRTGNWNGTRILNNHT